MRGLIHGWAIKLIVFNLLLSDVYGGEIANVQSKNVIHRGIHKRGLFYPVLVYPYNACSGILVAIAVPLDGLPAGRNVFLSYNFEANYNMPTQASESIPGEINRFPGLNEQVDPVVELPDDQFAQRSFEKLSADANGTRTTENVTIIDDKTEVPSSTVTSEMPTTFPNREVDDFLIISRKGIYRLLENRLNSNAIDGKKCLLLAICEAARFPLIESNGVLGHILHILFTPSSSMDEHLPTEYMKAENLGQQNDCWKYEKSCGFSLLNTFTKLI